MKHDKKYASRVLTFCRRWELMPGSPPAAVAPGFFRDLRLFDPDLELYWHPPSNRWQVYRVLHRAVVPSMDKLIHEWVVETPDGNYALPGAWLLDAMRRADRWSDFGDRKAAQRAFRRHLDDLNDSGERAREQEWDNLLGNLWNDIAPIKRGRVSVAVP